MKKIIVDASAIINGLPLLVFDTDFISAPSAVDEVKSKKGKKNLKTALEFARIDERIPKSEFLAKVRKATDETKDSLSKQDAELIALALEFQADIATDDYEIQNVAAKLNLKTIPVAEKGIKKIIHWQHYCPGCREKYDAPGICGICGTKLERKAKHRK